MSTTSRAAIIFSALSLLLAFVTPIWTIRLDAPQYPEGLGMHIRINSITGKGEHDLRNINGLNHYIGMKRIEPDSIRELKLMPWILGLLAATGLLCALSGRRKLLYAWTALFMVIAIVGLADFYAWEYDYGHNLDLEHASIKIPGMSYQPPLIGSKKLLNFTAYSWPAIGGWAVLVSLLVAMMTSLMEFRISRRTTPGQ